MHNKSQISRRGEWGDATVMENNKGQLNHLCRYCNYYCRSLDTIIKHLEKCKIEILKLKEGIDYVHCKLCNEHCQKLLPHIKLWHKDISIEEYKKKYGEVLTSKKTFEKYSKSNLGRVSWQTIVKENGVDLTDFYKKRGEKVSKNIMSNPAERERRSKQMKYIVDTVNVKPEIRKIFSDTAKITSARPDIIIQRSAQLQKWRDENPEDFQAKCVDKMLASKPQEPTWFSKPEKLLFKLLKKMEGYNFKFNQVVLDDRFRGKSNRKQVDIADKKNKIYIEFDGPYHFKLMGKEEKFADTRQRDELLNQYILDNKLILIRVSYDQFVDKKKIEKCFFLEECLEKLFKYIKDSIPGVYKIGKKYE